jgi:predicted ester cyclase
MKKLFFCSLIATALTYIACNNHNRDANSSDSTMNASSNATTNNEESMEKRNEQIVLSFFDAFNKKDVNAAFQYCAPGFTDYGDHTAKPMPFDSSKTMLTAFMTAFPDFTVQHPKAVCDGDTVMVWAEDTGTWKGDWMGQKATGKSFTIQDVDIFLLNNNGKITEHHNIQPFSSIAQQVGMKM